MIATTTPIASAPATINDSTARILEATAAVKQYMRRIPPECRTAAIAALAEVERRIREAR